jgi:hypothetical protein
MAIKTALASVVLMVAFALQAFPSAEATAPAELRLLVVNQQNAALPHATVTIYTLDGKPGVTIKADDKGVALFPAVSTGLTQIVVKSSGFSQGVEKTVVQPGVNTHTLTLRVASGRES